ncbi:adenylate cyclase [Acrasis kona]|uniref:Adenylate cyclase n=1 Tax=Acrasis kona TaxID=1008807 RepID=A0AAW2YV25_9EUKA
MGDNDAPPPDTGSSATSPTENGEVQDMSIDIIMQSTSALHSPKNYDMNAPIFCPTDTTGRRSLNMSKFSVVRESCLSPITRVHTPVNVIPPTNQFTSPPSTDEFGSSERKTSFSNNGNLVAVEVPPLPPETKTPWYRKLISINTIFTFVIIVTLVVVSIERIYNTSIRSTDVAHNIFALNYNYLRNIRTDSTVYNGVVNQFKSILGNDPYGTQIYLTLENQTLALNDVSTNITRFLLYDARAPDYNASVKAYNSSSALSSFATLPTIPNYRPDADPRSFLHLPSSYPDQTNSYLVSKTFTADGINSFALVKKLFDDDGVAYAIFSLGLLEKRVNTIKQTTDNNNTQITITEMDGSFILSTNKNGRIIDDTQPFGVSPYRNMSSTNSTELKALEAAVWNMGGWTSISQQSEFSYKSPNYGIVMVSKGEYQYPNRRIIVLVAWPESEWTNRINQNIYINVGVALAVLVISVIFTLSFSVPVARSIQLIKQCFNHVRGMQLDHPVINNTINSRFLWYETSELQYSFISMMNTLRSFQKYVPAYVVERLVNRGQEASLGLYPEHVSVFFLDIKDFTRHSEELSPNKLVNLMSEAFEGLSHIIDNHGGIIDKYIGDCIMAFFNQDCHEIKAVECSIECKNYMVSKSRDWTERDLPALECRIGINSGNVLIGNFGSSHRFNFTIIGDHVNLASKVESFNKFYDSVILITNHTLRKLPHGMFLLRRVERVQIKKDKSVLLFQVLKKMYQACADDLFNLEVYDLGFNLYLEGHFEKAKAAFTSITNYENDPVVCKKISQCDEWLNNAPSWMGSIKL